ncbi:MAG: flagellar hook basal-body protein [Candidatus Eremiobacteraeota bacterium]|nr:flagellar hook basal-body protein [Candidatus Eremiobacteraeota bacterium]
MFDMNNQASNIMNNQQMMNTYFNNLQNQFTPGFKAEAVNFNDLMGSTGSSGKAKKKQNSIIFTQGAISQTGRMYDLAINGSGFFNLSDGVNTHFSRDGRFVPSAEGKLVHEASGMKAKAFKLDAQGNISGGLTDIDMSLDPATQKFMGQYDNFSFDSSGKMYGERTISDPVTGQQVKETVPIYQMALSSFANPSGLTRSGTTTFSESETSGKAVQGVSGQGALGQVVPNSVELANVDYAQQAAAIGMAKINYNANFAAFRAMDKLLEQAIQLVK